MPRQHIKLISAEGHEFVVDYDAAVVSNTIKNILSAEGEYHNDHESDADSVVDTYHQCTTKSPHSPPRTVSVLRALSLQVHLWKPKGARFVSQRFPGRFWRKCASTCTTRDDINSSRKGTSRPSTSPSILLFSSSWPPTTSTFKTIGTKQKTATMTCKDTNTASSYEKCASW